MAICIHCPVQNAAEFSFDICMSCKYFTLTKPINGPRKVRCKKNKAAADAAEFNSAFYHDYLGMDYRIEIKPEENTNPA